MNVPQTRCTPSPRWGPLRNSGGVILLDNLIPRERRMIRNQQSFVEAFASTRLGRNERLEQVARQVKWYRFEKLLRKLEPEAAGRPPFEPLMMFKALLLQQWYALSDAQLEEALNDRVSFRRFLGLMLDADAPDHTTLCRFRNRLVEAGLITRLFAEFDRQMEERGLLLKRGTMIDATLVEAACTRPPAGEQASDPDARFVKREGQPGATLGYKAHVGVDQGTRLIRSAVLTPANVNETEVADSLIRGDERAVYADKAYDTKARRNRLRAAGIKDRIMHRPNKHHPVLPPWLARRNGLIAPIRAGVETIFAVLKRRMNFLRARYIGLVKNGAHLLMLALAYNMRRMTALAS
jgi:IS5 family transposase